MLKRSARILIGVKLTHSYVMQLLFRKTARVVQPLQSQLMAFANGWDMGVWRLQYSKQMCHNLAANKEIPDLILKMLAVINNVMMKEFSRRHSARGVPVRHKCSTWMMAPVATVYAKKVMSDLIPMIIAVRITAMADVSKQYVTGVTVRPTWSMRRMAPVVANVRKHAKQGSVWCTLRCVNESQCNAGFIRQTADGPYECQFCPSFLGVKLGLWDRPCLHVTCSFLDCRVTTSPACCEY